jgi:hypothetical protein
MLMLCLTSVNIGPFNLKAEETDTFSPEISSVDADPGTVGYGFNVTIGPSVTDNMSGVNLVKVNITFPDNTYGNYTMNKTGGDTYEYILSDTWQLGQYNYTIWTIDNASNANISSQHSFNVSAQATISVCTVKDSYGDNEFINITDPPSYDPPLIGYELLDGDVLHIWNSYNSYYFNTSSGIQLTNHYGEYWSHNVLMLGYYNNDQWNLIYRTDGLSGFNKDIDTDNETYVNATLWKELTYGGYDFRLAVRYHLGVDDSDLTVIPYIKNLGQAIPYTLGFGWEIKDIKIADTYENDTIRLFNGADWVNYSLDQTLDNSYTNMDYNTTFILEGLNEGKYFRRTLYLRWNHTLDYLLKVKSRTGQYNAPVTVFIKIGTLAQNQEKYTMMNWLDSDDWLGLDSRNYHSCCGYEGPYGPAAALDGIDVWTHLSTEDHWLVIDLKKAYNIKKVRGRSDTGNDPTSVDIYISDDPNNWGSAVQTGITTWQDTSNWAEVNITDTVGRYVNISITSTEGGASTDYLEFGGIPTPMTILDVYGEVLSNVTYYFNSYDNNVDWATNPSYMVDGSTSNYASTGVGGDVERCNGNTCSGTNLGSIFKVEMRGYGYYSNDQHDIILMPVFGGLPGSEYTYETTSTVGWSPWFNITDDDSAPSSWSWSDVTNLDCDVTAELKQGAGPQFTLYCSKVEIRVTYDPVPEISNPYPSDGSTGISLTPTLNITISDAYGECMNITWLSNSSGSWQAFGTNNSVGNGTYHQNFSNATENGKWWYWKVNVSDGPSYNVSSVYKFYTGYETKIENTGSTNISGYLSIQVQYYCDPLDKWVVADDTINEATPRTINAGGQLALDTIFNGLVNTSNLSYGNGTYRVYVAFRDPDGNVLKCDNEDAMEGNFEVKIARPLYGWFKLFADDGFGKASNLFTRGITIYKDEMYIGTENHNKSKLNLKDLLCNGFLAGTSITMANGSYKNIEDIEVGDIVKACDIGNGSYINANVTVVFNYTSEWLPDNYLKFNNQLCVSPNHLLYVNSTLVKAEETQVGDYFTDVNSSNVTITSTANMSEKPSGLYNFLIAVNGSEEPLLPSNLTYFAEDVQVYPWGSSNISDYCCNWGFPIITLFKLGAGHVATSFLTWLVCAISDGCELWKYNYTTKEWTELIGNTTGDSDLYSGFGDHRNCGVGDMVEFNGKLYVGTGHNKGCEIWQYDGSSWEQVVGENDTASIGRGFNDPFNSIAATMEVFENSSGVTHLYVGTINFNWGPNGFCQIWRTADGENWYNVVDKGFRDNGAESDVKNAYLWSMEVFQDKLYAGTFNIPYPDIMPFHHRGCQLWRTDTGNACEWEKVTLPGGNYGNGFGEDKNYGIRKLVKWGNNLYVGVAASAVQFVTKKALEIWKYNGTNWTCIVGNDTGAPEDEKWYDGFGDYYNKYPWSMVVAKDTLWIGTLNHRLKVNLTKPFVHMLSKGCEVWCYNGTDLIASVEDVNGEEDNGFGQWFNRGARSMIEYPVGSGNVVVGTMTVNNPLDKDVEEEGCEIWMWHP